MPTFSKVSRRIHNSIKIHSPFIHTLEQHYSSSVLAFLTHPEYVVLPPTFGLHIILFHTITRVLLGGHLTVLGDDLVQADVWALYTTQL